jgi:hypothetical protein
MSMGKWRSLEAGQSNTGFGAQRTPSEASGGAEHAHAPEHRSMKNPGAFLRSLRGHNRRKLTVGCRSLRGVPVVARPAHGFVSGLPTLVGGSQHVSHDSEQRAAHETYYERIGKSLASAIAVSEQSNEGRPVE